MDIVTTKRQAKQLIERGLTTVEYAIGLLAAATAALLLVRIFSDNSFFQTVFDWVVDLFTSVATAGGGGGIGDILGKVLGG